MSQDLSNPLHDTVPGVREVVRFIGSVVRRISAYVTGGIIAAAVVVYERLVGRNVSWGAIRFGLAAFLIVAVYLTWLAEHRRVQELEAEKLVTRARAKRREILARFMIRGQELAQRLARGHGPTETVDMDDIENVEEWGSDVELYLHEAYGMAHVARFEQDAFFPRGIVSPGNIGQWRADWERAVQGRCANLETFIRETPE